MLRRQTGRWISELERARSTQPVLSQLGLEVCTCCFHEHSQCEAWTIHFNFTLVEFLVALKKQLTRQSCYLLHVDSPLFHQYPYPLHYLLSTVPQSVCLSTLCFGGRLGTEGSLTCCPVLVDSSWMTDTPRYLLHFSSRSFSPEETHVRRPAPACALLHKAPAHGVHHTLPANAQQAPCEVQPEATSVPVGWMGSWEYPFVLLVLIVALPHLLLTYFPSLKLFSSNSHIWHCWPYYFSCISEKVLHLCVSLKENRSHLLEIHHLPHLSEYNCTDGRNRWEPVLNEKGSVWEILFFHPDHFIFSDIISLWWGQIYLFIHFLRPSLI